MIWPKIINCHSLKGGIIVDWFVILIYDIIICNNNNNIIIIHDIIIEIEVVEQHIDINHYHHDI